MPTFVNKKEILFCTPATLNFAIFTRNLMNLYETTPNYIWPDPSNYYSEHTDLSTPEVISDWNNWWGHLLLERAAIIEQRDRLIDLGYLDDKPYVVDRFSNLQAAIDQAWPLFKHWWDYPYIGGKMALESVPATRADIFAEELSNSKTGWVFDIVYHLHEGRNIHNKNGMGWGIIEPNDMWNIQWVKSITQ